VTHGTYYIVSAKTEDRFDEADSLDAALRIARKLMQEGQAGEPVSIEHGGKVIRQLVMTADGKIAEEVTC
jgi:hypothetical protein